MRTTSLLAAVATLWLLAGPVGDVQAGPNEGGTLVFHTNTGWVYSDSDNYSGISGLDCGQATGCPHENEPNCQGSGELLEPTGRNDGSDQVWWVLAAFSPDTCPLIKDVAFGINWNNVTGFDVLDWGSDANDQLPEAGWPFAPGSGVQLRWDISLEAQLAEICWFAGRLISGSTKFEIAPHPTLPTEFGNGFGQWDPITDFSFLGLGISGQNKLPANFGADNGACCEATGGCSILTEAECTAEYLGDGTLCDPNPCNTEGACCLPSEVCIFTDPSDCSAQSGYWLGEGYPCTPDPCDIGACCFEAGGCGLLSSGDCTGTFHGVGSSCDPDPCPPWGACCFPSETCSYYTGADCAFEGGSYQGDGTDCFPNPCNAEESGACCDEDGNCSWVTPEQCAAEDGSFQGIGSGCTPNPCPNPTGACCKDDGDCFVLTSSECAGLSGSYYGNGTVCVPNPCPDPTGACCRPVGCSVVTAAQCETWDGTWQGPGSGCSPDPCPEEEGACCAASGTCTTRTSSECSTAGGSYLGDGTICVPDPCPDPTGACCSGSGVCSIVTAAVCASQSGSYLGDGTACAPDPCPDPTGACCRADGSCWVTTATLCAENGDAYQGDEAPCAPDPCPDPTGACCPDSGNCTVITALQCAELPGAYQGNGVACSPNPCPQATGACCFADGSCGVLTGAECATRPGSYQGDGTACSPNPCPEPTGACCASDGTCSVQTSAACSTAGGSFLGHGESCNPNPCPDPTGACCQADGTCSIQTAAGCDTADGSYQGHGTDCDPNPCPQPEGACCASNGSCSVQSREDCEGAGQSYQGNDSTCSPNPCPQPTGACCHADGRCELLTAVQCASSSSTYLGSDAGCLPDPCPDPEGACCDADGSCVVGTEAGCLADGDTYEGDDTACSPNPCPQPVREGACCQSDGRCSLTTRAACGDADGIFQGEDSGCSPNPCPQPPAQGACCEDDGACSVTTAEACVLLSGTYEGDESNCSPNPCPQPPAQGACCDPDGLCLQLTSGDCSTSGGTYEGDGTNCSPSPCPAPSTGACCLNGALCSVVTAEECDRDSGTFFGGTDVCDPTTCHLDSGVSVTVEGTGDNLTWAVTTPQFVESLNGHYRLGGDRAFSTITGFTRDGSRWTAPFPSSEYTPRGLECHFILDDGNLTVGKEETPVRIQTRNVGVTGPSLQAGRWQMIAAPIDVTGRSDLYSRLQAAFGDRAQLDWRMGTFDPTLERYVEVSSANRGGLVPGRAYWLGTVHPDNWEVFGSSTFPSTSSSDFSIELEPGWNMVGNPAYYPVTLDPSRLRVASADTLTFADAARPGTEWVASSIVTFDGDEGPSGSYKQAGSALPIWGGAWIRNRLDVPVRLLVPAEDVSSSRPALSRWDGGAETIWEAALRLESGLATSEVTIGTRSGEDAAAFLPPPFPDQTARIRIIGIPGTSVAGEDLFRDLRQMSPGETPGSDARPLEWILDVNSAEPARLVWSGIGSCAPGAGCEEWTLVLTDLESALSWPVHGQGTMDITSGSHRYRLEAWSQQEPIPETTTTHLSLLPNPSREGTSIGFVTSRAGPVRIEVLSPSGQRLWSEEQLYEAGRHSVLWNGRRDDGEPAPAGVYFVSVDGRFGTRGMERRTLKLTVLR